MEAPGRYEISTDRSRLDIALIHGFLRSSYWAQGIPRAIVERSIQHKHSSRRGLVTVLGKPGGDLAPGTLDSILKQAGLK